MAELNLYISEGLKREMDYFPGVDWERIVHEAVWKKLAAEKKANKPQRQNTWENDF